MLSPAGLAGPQADAGARLARTLVLLVLASRAVGGGYASFTEAVNLPSYQTPGLAVAALLVGLAASACAGILVWRRQAVFATAGVVDAAGTITVMLLLAFALRPMDRMGSLNWALAYAVSCASWLALGPMRWWRTMLACLLGAVYGAVALAPAGPAAGRVTAVVNAVSPPLYFGISAAIYQVLRRVSREIDAGQETERRQHGESARLRERERLFREMHQPVLAVLDAIAAGAAPEAELRARSLAEATALRRTFHGLPRAPAHGLQARLGLLMISLDGWTARLIDEEMTTEPRPAVTDALTDAVAGLLAAATAMPAPGQVRVRIQSDEGGTSVVVRVADGGNLPAAAIEGASGAMAAVAGTASLAQALDGEHRVMLWAPP